MQEAGVPPCRGQVRVKGIVRQGHSARTQNQAESKLSKQGSPAPLLPHQTLKVVPPTPALLETQFMLQSCPLSHLSQIF